MIRLLIASALLVACSPRQGQTSLWDQLLEIVEKRIEQAPDRETADFIALAGEHAWRHRERLLTLARGHLSDDGTSAAGALEVLYRLRAYRPLEWIGGPSFEEVNAKFFATMDNAVLSKAEHLISVHNEDVYRSMSLYLGMVHTPSAHEMLRKIAVLAKDNEQTLICLAWHRDPADMEFLLPYMLADNRAAASLPYHYRNSYGAAALPYLHRAVNEAKSRSTRENATRELKELKQ
jgi:hypothetical protein